MPQFLATTSIGLVDALEKELISLGVKVVDRQKAGVFFDGNWQDCYKVNLWSRIASKVLKPILDFTAYNEDELYNEIRKHDFLKYIDLDGTISVDASARIGKLGNQKIVAMKVKDAIVDQFRDKYGSRPNVDKDNPSLRVVVRAVKNQFNVSIDTTGESLFKRGYRRDSGVAPLKENMAAGLLDLAQWTPGTPLVDIMCGSGTFLIEAALKAMKVAPGTLRRGFSFQKFKNFEPETWDRLVAEALSGEVELEEIQFYGFDIDRKTLKVARKNSVKAGVDHLIQFQFSSVDMVSPPVESGMIISNPPYGVRIGEVGELKGIYEDIGFTMKSRFPGWELWVLSGNRDLIPYLKMKSSRKHQVFNGPIECRFLKYEVKNHSARPVNHRPVMVGQAVRPISTH